MFFDDHDRFLDTGTVFTTAYRLNVRHEAIIQRNRDVLKGARVLDIASHDGRWSYAALAAGAQHVTGVEARREGVDKARETFAHYGADESSYEFICGDIFEVMAKEQFDVDVVMCLGFLYHTYRHTELLSSIRKTNPSHVLVDTTVAKGTQPIMRLRRDDPSKEGHAVLDPYAHGNKTLVARPSAPAVRMMLEAYDFPVEDEVDWNELLEQHKPPRLRRDAKVGDYRDGSRVTMRARSAI